VTRYTDLDPNLTHTDFAIAWTGMLIFDLLVFGMTLYKSIVLPRSNRGNILDIFLRDGELRALRIQKLFFF